MFRRWARPSFASLTRGHRAGEFRAALLVRLVGAVHDRVAEPASEHWVTVGARGVAVRFVRPITAVGLVVAQPGCRDRLAVVARDGVTVAAVVTISVKAAFAAGGFDDVLAARCDRTSSLAAPT